MGPTILGTITWVSHPKYPAGVPGTQMSSRDPRDPEILSKKEAGVFGVPGGALVWERTVSSSAPPSRLCRSSLGSLLGSNRPVRLTNVQFNIVLEDSEPARTRLRQESYFIVQARSQYLVPIETLSPLPYPVPHHCLELAQKITKQKKKHCPGR